VYWFRISDRVFQCDDRPELHLTVDISGWGLSSYFGVGVGLAWGEGEGTADGIPNARRLQGRWDMAEFSAGAGLYVAGAGSVGCVFSHSEPTSGFAVNR